MKMSKGFVLFFSLAFVTACENSGTAPSTAVDSKDYAAIAMSLAPSINYAIPIDIAPNCYFNADVILNGNSVTAYQSSNVAGGQSCISEQRLCTDGLLSGQYSYASCTVAQQASCIFNGQTILHGGSVTGYLNSTENYGGACSSESRICNNGSLSGSFSFSNCSGIG